MLNRHTSCIKHKVQVENVVGYECGGVQCHNVFFHMQNTTI
jgi:hypothetical protein